MFDISEVCEPSLDTPPEIAEMPVVPSFEPADICLNTVAYKLYKTVRFSTYDPRPRPLPIPFRPGPAPSGNFFIGFCFRFCSEISESPDELPESPLTILLQSG